MIQRVSFKEFEEKSSLFFLNIFTISMLLDLLDRFYPKCKLVESEGNPSEWDSECTCAAGMETAVSKTPEPQIHGGMAKSSLPVDV